VIHLLRPAFEVRIIAVNNCFYNVV
jgi:hypothetical protein